jgi:hypothetical protein
MACFLAAILFGGDGLLGLEGWAAIGGLLIATTVGQVIGGLLGLARLRMMVVVVVFGVGSIVATTAGFALGPVAPFVIFGIFAAIGGYLGVASRLDVVAAWVPLSCAVAGAMVWMNLHGAVRQFESGHKHAVWDLFSMACVGGSAFLMLVFLATRQALALTVWQEVARARRADVPDEAGVAMARPGRGSFFVLAAFTLFVFATTALLSPYLFRTAPAEQGEGSSHEGDGKDPKKPKKNAHAKPKHGHGQGGQGQGHGGQGGQGNGGQGQDGQGQGGHGGQGQGGQGQGGQGHGGQGQGGQGHGGQGHGGQESQGQGHGSQGQGSQGSDQGGAGSQDGQEGADDPAKAAGGGDGPTDGESDGNDDGDESVQGGKKGDVPLDKPDTQAAEQSGRRAFSLGFSLAGLLLALALAILLFFIGPFPPLRRGLLLRHLERPVWPVSPTARVMNLWRRALAALAVVDLTPAAGETPLDFARRAEAELETTLGCGAPGLQEAAAMVEKIDYAGRGLGPGEEQTMRDLVMGFVRTIEPRIAAQKRFLAGWARAPEVE